MKYKSDGIDSGSLATRIVHFFISRRPLAHTLTILVAALGILSYLSLPQEIFPPITTNKIEIRATYPGTSPDTFDDIITSRIEDAVDNLEGIDLVESITYEGFCVVTLTLEPDTDVQDLLFRVRDALDLIKSDFPQDMDDPAVHRVIKKYPLLTLSISGADQWTLQHIAEEIQKRIQRIPNISTAVINGKTEPEIHIYLDNDKLTALSIEPLSVIKQLQALVNNRPLGIIKAKGNHSFITTYGGPKEVSEWENAILHIGNKKLYLGRIAKVKKELSEAKTLSHFNGKRNVSLTIFKTEQGSSIDLSHELKTLIKKWEQEFKGIKFDIYSDLSVYIKNRLNTVKSSAVVGLILVTISLYLFLNRGVAIAVMLGLPTAFLISFIYLAAQGKTINMLSLFSFLMALGMVVDDAIVVGENIFRHLEAGLDKVSAAVKGASEVFWPVSAATFTTVAAFLPLLMISGDIGVFLAIIPVFVSTVLIASLIEAFAILPVHAVELFKDGSKGKGLLSDWSKVQRGYQKIIAWALNHKRFILFSALLLFILSLVSAKLFMGFTLLPDFDTDQIYIRGKLGARHGLYETEELVSKIEKILLNTISDKDLESIATHIGSSFNDKMEFDFGEDLFQIFVNLNKPVPQNFLEKWIYPLVMLGSYESGTREHQAGEIVEQLQSKLSDISIERFEITKPKAGIVRADVEIGVLVPKTLNGTSKALEAAQDIKQALKKVEGVFNVQDDFDPGKREIELHINKRGKELGFTEGYLANLLANYYLNPKLIRVMKHTVKDMEVKTYIIGRDNLSVFQNLKVLTPKTKQVVFLKDITDVSLHYGQARIWKENGTRQITITASIDKSQITSSSLMKKISDVLEKIQKKGVAIEVRGEERVAGQALRDLLKAAIVAVFGIFIVLLLQFNSVKDALIVLTAAPLSFIGVVVGHIIMGHHMSIPSLLGFIGLAGVAVNDAIIMIDFLNKKSGCQKDLNSIAITASLRLRPIVLTSVTTIASLLPLIFFATGQARILSPMATSFGFGLLAATIANLLIIPTLYTTFQRKAKCD